MEKFGKLNYTIAFCTFYILGVISFFTNTIPVMAFLLLAVLIFGLCKNLISNRSAVFFYLMFSLALLNCHFQIKNYDALSDFIPSKGTIIGTVKTIPTTNNNDKTKFYLDAKSYQTNEKKAENLKARTIVTLYDSDDKLSKIKVGDEIKIEGKLRKPIRAKNPAQFDYSHYLKNHKTFSVFTSKKAPWEIISSPESFSGKFVQKLNDKRAEILGIHKKYMKSPNLEVLGGVVFGDDAINPPNEIKESFINSGLLHILAASGMNVSIIFGLWFFIGSRLKLNYRFVLLFGALLVVFYTLMTGMGPSILRAAFMIEFIILGKLIDRSTDNIALVFLVAFLMLLYNPAMINDVGFQLSFMVTFALMFYCPVVLEKIENKPLEFLSGTVMIPLVAQFWAAPIQMFYFNTFATYSFLANLAITPFIMIISALGFAGSIIAMVPIYVVADKTCMIFDFILNPIVSGLVNISNYFSSLPNSLLCTIHPTAFQLLLYYSALVIFGFMLHHGFKNKKLLTSFLVLVVVFALSFIKISNHNCEVLVFDVGNADCFLIKTPENKYIIIDTAHGSFDPEKKTFSQADAIINKYLKDNGIRTIDLMILTHYDADHAGGAVDIMKAVEVKRVILNKDRESSKTAKALFAHIDENKINAVNAVNKENVFSENGFHLVTFTPDFTGDNNDNDNSIVTLMSFGDFDMLFMGDGGVRTFNRVKRNFINENNDIEVLKVGHHGAKFTVTSKMIRTINPDAAVVSTGMNFYGHPDRETLDTLSKNNVKSFRTDVDNALKISSDGKVYEVLGYDTGLKKFVRLLSKPCVEPAQKPQG